MQLHWTFWRIGASSITAAAGGRPRAKETAGALKQPRDHAASSGWGMQGCSLLPEGQLEAAAGGRPEGLLGVVAYAEAVAASGIAMSDF